MKTSKGCSIFCGTSLRVTEVGGYGDNSVGNGASEVSLVHSSLKDHQRKFHWVTPKILIGDQSSGDVLNRDHVQCLSLQHCG